jgi:hypothetical protein
MEEIIGIVIQPGGLAGLFRERADLFFERSVGLEDVWAGTSLAERLCEIPAPDDKLVLVQPGGLSIRWRLGGARTSPHAPRSSSR